MPRRYREMKDYSMSRLSNAIMVPMIILVIFVLAFSQCFVAEEYDKLMLYKLMLWFRNE